MRIVVAREGRKSIGRPRWSSAYWRSSRAMVRKPGGVQALIQRVGEAIADPVQVRLPGAVLEGQHEHEPAGDRVRVGGRGLGGGRGGTNVATPSRQTKRQGRRNERKWVIPGTGLSIVLCRVGCLARGAGTSALAIPEGTQQKPRRRKTSSRPKRRTVSSSVAQWRDPCILPLLYGSVEGSRSGEQLRLTLPRQHALDALVLGRLRRPASSLRALPLSATKNFWSLCRQGSWR